MKIDSSREAGVQRLRDRLRETTAHAILDAAERTLADEGLQAARMEAIAARAGVAVGTVYNYFADRDALLTALLEARRTGLVAALDATLATAHGSGREDWRVELTGFITALLAHVEAHRRFFAIVFQGELGGLARSGAAAGGKRAQHPRATFLEVYERMRALCDRGVAAGVLRADDADFYPAALFGLFRALVVRELYRDDARGNGAPLVGLAPTMVRLFLAGAAAGAR